MSDLCIDPDFHPELADETCFGLLEHIPRLVGELLPNSVVSKIVVTPYAGTLRQGERCTESGQAYRINLTCNHGLEELIVGQTEGGSWLATKSLGGRGRRVQSRSRT